MDTDVLAWLQPLVAWWHAHFDGAGASAGASLSDVADSVGAALDLPSLLALAAALGWASGLRLYLVVFVVGLSGVLGWWDLPGGLQTLQHPVLLVVSGGLLFVEFFADKIPGLDSLWDLLNSVLRVPAGAALAAGVFGADSATMALVAALLGGTLAASSQVAKTTTRTAINTSPEPFSNVMASLVEDGLVLGALWLATHHPQVFAVVLTVVVVLLAWLTWVLLSFLRAAWHRFFRLFSDSEKVA